MRQQAIDGGLERIKRQGSPKSPHHSHLVGILRVGESDPEGGRGTDSNLGGDGHILTDGTCIFSALQTGIELRLIQTDCFSMGLELWGP